MSHQYKIESAITAHLFNGQTEIKIYAQDITDYKIIGALAKAARHGVSVKIVLSVSPEKFANGKFSFLQKAGVILHNTHHFYIHAKTMLVDQKLAMLGSINFTKASLEDNRELSVITEDQKVIRQLNDTFNHDWSETWY